jgi:hypothetical protein
MTHSLNVAKFSFPSWVHFHALNKQLWPQLTLFFFLAQPFIHSVSLSDGNNPLELRGAVVVRGGSTAGSRLTALSNIWTGTAAFKGECSPLYQPCPVLSTAREIYFSTH